MRWLLLALLGCSEPRHDMQMIDARAGDAPPPDAAGPTLADCSNFASVDEQVAFINDNRLGYEPHDRWRGIPWQGEYHTNATFAVQFAVSSELAAQANIEAARLIAGGLPAGVNVPGQNGENRELWIDGLNTAAWRISAFEYPGDWTVPMWGHEKAALHPSNGSARMALFYHDFGGAGPAIKQFGVGAAIAADCRVAWVLQFAP